MVKLEIYPLGLIIITQNLVLAEKKLIVFLLWLLMMKIKGNKLKPIFLRATLSRAIPNINNQESSGKSLSISKTLLLFAFAHQNKNELFTIEGGVVGLKDFVNEYLGINALLDLRNPFHV